MFLNNVEKHEKNPTNRKGFSLKILYEDTNSLFSVIKVKFQISL